MSKIGIIFCSWQAEDLLERSLRPWIEARATQLDNNQFLICAVSVPFEGFPQDPLDNTQTLLHRHFNLDDIDNLISGEVPMKETEARGQALKWLVDQGCDLTIQVDADEFYTAIEIENIFQFVAKNPLIVWFRGSLKNYVLDDKTYLVKPFTPPRIHRVSYDGYKADCFLDDNNIGYIKRTEEGTYCSRDEVGFPHITIPKAIVWTRHESWGNNERSRKKILYQNSRPGWKCDFDWDDSRGGLIWRDGVAIPETARDE